MGNGGYTFIRRAFCWINLIFWLCGCAFLGIGLWLRFSHEGYATLLPQHAALSADSLLITVGVMSFVVAFFGCCGSWFESRFLLIVVSGFTKMPTNKMLMFYSLSLVLFTHHSDLLERIPDRGNDLPFPSRRHQNGDQWAEKWNREALQCDRQRSFWGTISGFHLG